jgi:hypothetical protein
MGYGRVRHAVQVGRVGGIGGVGDSKKVEQTECNDGSAIEY